LVCAVSSGVSIGVAVAPAMTVISNGQACAVLNIPPGSDATTVPSEIPPPPITPMISRLPAANWRYWAGMNPATLFQSLTRVSGFHGCGVAAETADFMTTASCLETLSCRW